MNTASAAPRGVVLLIGLDGRLASAGASRSGSIDSWNAWKTYSARAAISGKATRSMIPVPRSKPRVDSRFTPFETMRWRGLDAA